MQETGDSIEDNEDGTGRIEVHEDDEEQVFGFCDFVELSKSLFCFDFSARLRIKPKVDQALVDKRGDSF